VLQPPPALTVLNDAPCGGPLLLQVCGCSVLLAALSYPASRYWYKRNWRKVNNNEAFERRMLRCERTAVGDRGRGMGWDGTLCQWPTVELQSCRLLNSMRYAPLNTSCRFSTNMLC
jgi:hypothetical protein